MTGPDAPPVHRAILAQLAAAVLLAAGSLLLSGAVAGYSTLLGGLTSALPNGYFAWRAFRHRGARSAGRAVRSLMRGEMVKLAMTLALFALVFGLIRELHHLALIAGFAAVHITGVAAAAVVVGRGPARSKGPGGGRG